MPLRTAVSYTPPYAAVDVAATQCPAVSRHLDSNDIGRAILSFGSLAYVSGLPNPHFAAEIARAANDWLIDTWLPADDRLFGSVLIANQLPEIAAAEIRRVGPNPRIVQVVMSGNGVGQSWGHPLYHPIYEAAADLGLPIALRAGADGGINPRSTAGGASTFSVEHTTLAVEGMMTGLTSIIAGGALEKYSDLRFIFDGGGAGWIPVFLWRYDASFKGVRREVPWVCQLPTEYFRDRMCVTTAELEVGPDPDILGRAFNTIGGESCLLFASGYPDQSGADALARVANGVPVAWRHSIVSANPLRSFRWPSPPTRTHRSTKESQAHV